MANQNDITRDLLEDANNRISYLSGIACQLANLSIGHDTTDGQTYSAISQMADDIGDVIEKALQAATENAPTLNVA